MCLLLAVQVPAVPAIPLSQPIHPTDETTNQPSPPAHSVAVPQRAHENVAVPQTKTRYSHNCPWTCESCHDQNQRLYTIDQGRPRPCEGGTLSNTSTAILSSQILLMTGQFVGHFGASGWFFGILVLLVVLGFLVYLCFLDVLGVAPFCRWLLKNRTLLGALKLWRRSGAHGVSSFMVFSSGNYFLWSSAHHTRCNTIPTPLVSYVFRTLSSWWVNIGGIKPKWATVRCGCV